MKNIKLLLGLSLAVMSCSPEHTATPPSSAAPTELTLDVNIDLQNDALQILQSSCADCHGDNSTSRVNHITDVTRLIETKLITPGNPDEGRLLGSVNEDRMPPRSPLSREEKQILHDWIASMKWIEKTKSQ